MAVAPNDLFADAIEITRTTDALQTFTVNNDTGSNEAAESSQTGTRSVWWKFTPQNAGYTTFTVESAGGSRFSLDDVVITLFTGSSLATLTKQSEVFASDANSPSPIKVALNAELVVGTTYYIRVAAEFIAAYYTLGVYGSQWTTGQPLALIPPAYRFPFDKDGTLVNRINNGLAADLTLAQKQALNDEATSSYEPGSGNSMICFVFPQARTLTHFYIGDAGIFSSHTDRVTVEVSSDTTNGQNGNWTGIAHLIPFGGAWKIRSGSRPITEHRNQIRVIPSAPTNVKGVRFTHTNSNMVANAIHLYGSLPTGAAHRLMLWHPTADQPLAFSELDLGQVARSSGNTERTFRVKNLSATHTASAPILAAEVLTDSSSPTNLSQLTFSQGGAFAATQTLASIAPGGTSPVCTMRFTPTATAVTGPWTWRIVATPASFV